MKRILLGQLYANGDCLHATILARQIKNDQPDSHLTWAISSSCRSIAENNPDIDEVWEIPAYRHAEQERYWRLFEAAALRRLLAGDFDKAYLSQLWPDNMQNFDGTPRPSLLRAYGRRITVPVKCVLNLTTEEIARVDSFANEHRICDYRHRVLVETIPASGQSYLTPELADFIAEIVRLEEPDCCFILAPNAGHPKTGKGIVDASGLSVREIAALSHYASLLVGGADEVTIATQSTAGKQLPMLQLLSGDKSNSASIVHDHEYWGLPSDHIVELVDVAPGQVARCILAALRDGIDAARRQFHKAPELRFDHYLSTLKTHLLSQGRYLDAMQSLKLTADRYGWLPDLLAIAVYAIIPNLLRDPKTGLDIYRLAAESFAQDVTARWNLAKLGDVVTASMTTNAPNANAAAIRS